MVANGISWTPTGGVVLAATIRAAPTSAQAAIQPEREKRGVVLRSGCSSASMRALICHRFPVVAPGASCGAGARRVNSCKCVRQAAYGRGSPVADNHPVVAGHFALDLQAAADPIDRRIEEQYGLRDRLQQLRPIVPTAQMRHFVAEHLFEFLGCQLLRARTAERQLRAAQNRPPWEPRTSAEASTRILSALAEQSGPALQAMDMARSSSTPAPSGQAVIASQASAT